MKASGLLCWDAEGWLLVTNTPMQLRWDTSLRPMWKVSCQPFHDVFADPSRIGAATLVERRPDRMDCEHIPHDLLSKLYGPEGEMRAALVPVDHRDVLIVEGHPAMFYKGYRLPLPSVEPNERDAYSVASFEQGLLQVQHMLDDCDNHRAQPEWLMCWRCRVCGGYVLAMPGKNRMVEFFTGTINKDFSNRMGLCVLPDDYLAKTCIDCGDISLTSTEAAEVGTAPDPDRVKAYLERKAAENRALQEDGGKTGAP